MARSRLAPRITMVAPQHDPVRLQVGDDLKQLLRISHRAGLAVLLIGHTGIGKSEIVEETARDLGIGFVAFDLSLCEPSDLLGLPRVDADRTVYAPPARLPREGAGILLLEELNRAERFVLAPALQLLSARRLNDYVLPPGWSIVAATNPEGSDYDVDRLDPALRSRFLQIHVEPDRHNWIGWARRTGLHPAVVRLVESLPEALEAAPPRSWTFASRVLQTVTEQEQRDLDLVFALLRGCLPEPLTVQLANLVRHGELSTVSARAALAIAADDLTLHRQLAELKERGRSDRLNQLAKDACAILRGADLAAMLLRGEFSLGSFECFLGYLTGDAREQCQQALGRNHCAATLLGVDYAVLLQRGWRDTDARKELLASLEQPLQRHRVQLFVTGLCHYLKTGADLTMIRRNNKPLRVLGQILGDLPPEEHKQLAKCLIDRHVEWIPA